MRKSVQEMTPRCAPVAMASAVRGTGCRGAASARQVGSACRLKRSKAREPLVDGRRSLRRRDGARRCSAAAADTDTDEGGGAVRVSVSESAAGESATTSRGGAQQRCNCGNCDGSGRIIGGIGAVPGFRWWPIKAYRPCPGLVDSGKGYTR